MYMCVHVYVYMYVYMYVYVCKCMFMCVYVYVYVCICMYLYVSACIYIDMVTPLRHAHRTPLKTLQIPIQTPFISESNFGAVSTD